ncbi:MAG: endo-1,4-beta-xylanase [Bacilli bacterium]
MPSFQSTATNATAKIHKKYKEMSAKDLGNYSPNLAAEMKRLTQKRINEIAAYYGDKVDSWDVVNESATDWGKGLIVKGDSICKSWYGMMPGDYPYLAFKTAQNAFPQNVKLNINDYKCDGDYTSEIKDLLSRGCKVDIVGSQMHLFNPSRRLRLRKARKFKLRNKFKNDGRNKRRKAYTPQRNNNHSPDTTEKGRMMQAIIARNLYRKWFSIKPMMGITWWNVVDDCGAPRTFHVRSHARNESQTRLLRAKQPNKQRMENRPHPKRQRDGTVKFRGFKGKYRLSGRIKTARRGLHMCM